MNPNQDFIRIIETGFHNSDSWSQDITRIGVSGTLFQPLFPFYYLLPLMNIIWIPDVSRSSSEQGDTILSSTGDMVSRDS